MIKPSSGGFDMYMNQKQIDWHNDIVDKHLERIKELESDLTAFIDEVNRLTAIKKELEELNDTIRNDYNELLKELERYKEFYNKLKQRVSGTFDSTGKNVQRLIKEFEEAKE